MRFVLCNPAEGYGFSRALGLLPHGLCSCNRIYQHSELSGPALLLLALIGFGIAFWDYQPQTKVRAAPILLLEVTSKMAFNIHSTYQNTTH